VAYVHERVEVVRFGAQGRALLAGHRHLSRVTGRKSLPHNGGPGTMGA
jgi:hypothetical protein